MIIESQNTGESDNNISLGKISDGDRIKICAIIENRKNKITKSNSQMAFLQLEDAFATIETLVFPKVLMQYSNILQEENIIVAEGRVSMREDEEPKFILESAMLLNEMHPQTKKKPTIYIRAAERNNAVLEKYNDIAARFPGEMPVCIFFKDVGGRLYAPENLRLSGSDESINYLKEYFGAENVIIQ